MEAVQSLECSREGLPGVGGAERIDGGGRNWGCDTRSHVVSELVKEVWLMPGT